MQTIVLIKSYLSAGAIHALRFLKLYSLRLNNMILGVGGL